jgi:ComF family protein
VVGGAGLTQALRAGAHAMAHSVSHAMVELLLPRQCVACERLLASGERGLMCGVCWSRLLVLPQPQCARCGHPVPPALLARHGRGSAPRSCRWCALLPAFVRAARSVCWVPRGPGGTAVHAMKYDGWHALADDMAERMARLAWPRDVEEERAALVPVPLAAERRRERGFNQSEAIAGALARRWCVPVWPDVLERARATVTQTRLTPGERLGNVAGAFRATGTARERLRGRHVVLVDDVVTTAATLNACADVLFASGARVVSYVTFGRAPALGDRP